MKTIQPKLQLQLKEAVGALVGLFSFFVVTPHVKKSFPSFQKTLDLDGKADLELQKTGTKEGQKATDKICLDVIVIEKSDSCLTPEQRDAIWVFRSLLVFNACLESF